MSIFDLYNITMFLMLTYVGFVFHELAEDTVGAI